MALPPFSRAPAKPVRHVKASLMRSFDLASRAEKPARANAVFNEHAPTQHRRRIDAMDNSKKGSVSAA